MDWLTSKARADLVVGAPRKRYRTGEMLFHEGDPPGPLSVLLSGHVKVFGTSDRGTEVILSVLGPGELIGELSALDRAVRTASVRAIEPVEAAVISAAAFEAFLTDHPDSTLALLRLLAGRLRTADRQQIDFGSTDTGGRLARRLLELADAHGVAVGGTVRIDLPLTQEELAAWIGASRESVAKSLRTLRTRGLVSTERRTISILDIEGLRART